MTTREHCVLWIPESSAPYRDPGKVRPYSVPVPEAPIGIDFRGLTDNADLHILWRALLRNKLEERAVEPSRLARAQEGYRELVEYRIEYEIDSKNIQRTLPLVRPLPKGALNGTPSATGPWTVRSLNVIATLEDPSGNSKTEKLVMPVDIAFADPAERGIPSGRIILAASERDTMSIDDLASTMSEALFKRRSGDDSVDTQYERFRTECYKTAALILKSRTEGLIRIVERQVRQALDSCLEEDEALNINVYHTATGLEVTVRER